MKKLIALAAVATCGAALAVESANIVGYQNKAFVGGGKFNVTANTFKPIGKEATEVTLGDISASSDWQSGTDELKTMTLGGGIDKAYTYVGATDAADWGCPAGWYLTADVADDSIEDLTPYCKNSTVLPMTQGFLVQVSSSSTTLIYAGQVLDADQPASFTGGGKFNVTGNISPVDITLGDITASSDWQSGTDELKTMTLGGGIDKAYTYVGATDASDWGCPAGWYLTADVADDSIEDLTPYCKNSVTVEAGQGFLVQVSSGSTTITVPSAL